MAKGQVRSNKEPRKPKAKEPAKGNANASRKSIIWRAGDAN
jgi:hypothetical protein